MQRYQPFWDITAETLDLTLAELQIDDPAIRQRLLDLYLDLAAYDEVADELAAMAGQGMRLPCCQTAIPKCWSGRWAVPGSAIFSMLS